MMKGGRIHRVLSLHCFRDSQVKGSRKQSEYDPEARRVQTHAGGDVSHIVAGRTIKLTTDTVLAGNT